MDYIYIDASIIEGNNFTEGKRINEIFKLAEEGHIQILLTAITYNEIVNSAIRIIRDSVSKFKNYRNNTRILRNIPTLKSEFENLDEEQCIGDFLEEFDRRLNKAKVIIVDYPTVNVKDVFDRYFKDEFPFSRGEKKHEFPDAFALISVENWCKEHKQKCFVFSHDKDLLNYESSYLTIVRSYEKYLDRKLREIEVQSERKARLDRVSELFENEKARLENEISDWLLHELDNTVIFYKHFELDVHSISIIDEAVSLSEFQIISINDYEILMEANANIYYKVEVEVDDVNAAIYDSEEGKMYYYDNSIEIVEDSQVIKIELKVTSAIVDNKIMEIEIEEINNGQELNLY